MYYPRLPDTAAQTIGSHITTEYERASQSDRDIRQRWKYRDFNDPFVAGRGYGVVAPELERYFLTFPSAVSGTGLRTLKDRSQAEEMIEQAVAAEQLRQSVARRYGHSI